MKRHGRSLLYFALFWMLLAFAPGRVAADTIMTLRAVDLGYPEEVMLRGTVSATTFSIPVPAGLRPHSVLFYLRLSPTIDTGMLILSDSDHVVGTLGLPTEKGVVSMSLEGAAVKDGFLTMKLQSVLDPQDPTCASQLLKWVTVSDLKVVLSGEPKPPKTVATFWPPDLRAIHFYITTPPDRGVADAVLDISAFAQRLAMGHGITVTVGELTDPLPFPVDDPESRSVIVESDRSMLSPEVSLIKSSRDWPVLLLSARPEHLRVASRMVIGAARPFLFSRRNTLRYYHGRVSEPATKVTFSSLGYRNTVLEGNTRLTALYSFSQADLGSSVKAVAVRVVGTYTPIPKGGSADLSVMVNGGLVHSVPLSKGGSFDLYASIPKTLLKRDNKLEVVVLYTPPGNNCTVGAHDIVVDVHEDSYLEVKHGKSLPPGFDRFPQALLSSFTVACDDLTAESLQEAAGLVASLQRLSRVPLEPSYSPLEEAMKGELPVIAVVDNPLKVEPLSPPLLPSPFRLIDPYGNIVMELNQHTRFAVLEAFSTRSSAGPLKAVRRSKEVLLLTSNGYQDGMSRVVETLSSGDGWYDLSGDVLILPEGQEPIKVPVRSGHFQVKPVPETPAVWWHRFRVAIYVLSTVMVFIFLLWSYPRVVRKGPSA